MFSNAPNYSKLKTNLRLAVNRLKLLEKKKTELTQKARKEIADYISTNKEDRARIRVEHIIREDYTVEAYEIIEMYCDMLVARFGLIQQMKTLDEGVEEAINSILWAAPRLQGDVQELKAIADQLTVKYGKPFAEACRENRFNKVSPKLLHKLGVQAPPKILVEKYMIEIAKSHNVPFTPDRNVMRDDEIASAEAMLIDFQNRGQQSGWMYPPTIGFAGGPPPPGSGSGGGQQQAAPPLAYQQPAPAAAPAPFSYPALKPQPTQSSMDEQAPPPEKVRPPAYEFAMPPAASGGTPTAPGAGSITFPDLPEPPMDHFAAPPPGGASFGAPPPAGAGSGDDLDFDDLTRRFQELKKKK